MKAYFTVETGNGEVTGVHACLLYTSLFDEIQKHITCEAKARSCRLSSSHVAPEHPVVQKAIAMKRTPFGSPTLSDQALIDVYKRQVPPFITE